VTNNFQPNEKLAAFLPFISLANYLFMPTHFAAGVAG